MLIDVDDVALGHDTKMRWNDPNQWVWSEKPTHAAIVSADTFETAQKVFTGSQRAAVRRNRTKHPYVLSGLVRCDLCGRRMQGSWNNGQPSYRCKFPTEYAVSEKEHAKTVYVREDAIVPALDTWIGSLFDDDHLDATARALAAASEAIPDDNRGRVLDLRRQLKECDAKLAKYRELLEHDSDVTVLGDVAGDETFHIWSCDSPRRAERAECALRVEDVVDRPDQTGEGLIVSPRLAGDLADPVEDLGGSEAPFEVDLISVVVEVEGEHVGVETPPSPAPAGPVTVGLVTWQINEP
ncbi:MAG: recombinase zinc beta ribbon domain-containing protein [Acidimicrobiia bacterium]|nr:recombinase zinc beta ribbon domain-containing protein [Acidimicrobiia bacterium]